MKKLLTAALLVSFCTGASAQESSPLDLSSRWDERGNAVVEVSRHDGGIYSLVLEFYEVENMTVDKFRRVRVASIMKVATLTREDSGGRPSFKYRYRYVPGEVNPRKVDTTFVYRLPYGLSESREVHAFRDFNERHGVGKTNSVDYKEFQFFMNRADTVYAVRKGKVIRVIDGHDPKTGVGYVSMRTSDNEIHVEHSDGTIARYEVLEKGSMTVAPGDTVFPGTPVGLAGSYDGETYQIRFSLWYQTDNLSKINSLSDYQITYHYIDPIFATSEGEFTLKPRRPYRPVCTEEMDIRETTKKELKSRGR